MCFKRRHVIGCKEGACATDDAAPGPAGLVFGIPSRPRQDQDQRLSRPRHFYFYLSTIVLNTSIILFINPSTSVSMLQSNFKNSSNTFLFFLNNIHLSLFLTSVWLFLFRISVTPHSCLVFTSSHRLLCAANLGETLNVEASAINMVFTSLLWVQLHCGSFQTLALRRNGMEISDNAMRRAVVLSTLALIMAKVALWDG